MREETAAVELLWGRLFQRGQRVFFCELIFIDVLRPDLVRDVGANVTSDVVYLKIIISRLIDEKGENL